MRWALLVLVALGCKGAEPPVHAALAGRVHIGGVPVTLLTCRPGHAVHVFVDIDTTGGTLRFGEGKLALAGTELDCEKLDRRWGGGIRNDGSSYFRGTLSFQCGGAAGDLTLDCGQVTAEEAGELDHNAAAARAARGSSAQP